MSFEGQIGLDETLEALAQHTTIISGMKGDHFLFLVAMAIHLSIQVMTLIIELAIFVASIVQVREEGWTSGMRESGSIDKKEE